MDRFDNWLSPAQRAAIDQNSGFSSVQFMTAYEKQKVLTQWRKLMHWLHKNGVPSDPPKLWVRGIYDHLQVHCSGYIAHYDIWGFWREQLSTPAAATAFFNELEEHLLCRFGALRDYADINEAMMDVARAVRPQILSRLAQDDREQARAQIVALAARAGLPQCSTAEAVMAMASGTVKPVAKPTPEPARSSWTDIFNLAPQAQADLQPSLF